MNKNKGLDHDEQLLFEVGNINKTGVDLDDIENLDQMIGDSFSENEIGLAGLSEPETIRHYVRLSRKNYSIDAGLYPLGSCTMKHNPRLNEKMARLEGFSDIHPLQPISTCQGALELIDLISSWLKELTGMAAVTMTPKAGAQGELCGMMAIKQALLDRNELNRKVVLVPDSAHGTNPATAAFLGFEVKTIKSNDKGLIDFSDFKNNIDENFDRGKIVYKFKVENKNISSKEIELKLTKKFIDYFERIIIKLNNKEKIYLKKIPKIKGKFYSLSDIQKLKEVKSCAL